MKRAIIDIDGVLADSTARFAKAEEAKQQALTMGAGERDATKTYWLTAFDCDLVALDTLIPNADKAIHRLWDMGWLITLLTSRPESLKEATETWLVQYGLEAYYLVMKPQSKQFTKTVQWKADEVRQMATSDDWIAVLFIDDEEGNRAAVEALGLENVRCRANLDEYKPK
jgi:ribonucleotide monophosphatase NagD (HAD superfamily)